MIVIAVIDYGLGNIQSICRALEKSNVDVKLTRNHKEILSSDGVVLPGVGAFPHGMKKINSFGLAEILVEFSKSGKPMLGICLGMQLLFEESSEFRITSGLGIIPGKVEKLSLGNGMSEKLPHVSWNEIISVSDWDSTVLENVVDGADVYFVHSYCAKPSNERDILSLTTYSGESFCSVVKNNNVYGCQFHPEKSGELGLNIINNFVGLCRGYNGK